MDAQKTYVLWLNRNTEEQAFSGRGARARQVAAHLSAEVRAVLANTDLPTRTTRRGKRYQSGLGYTDEWGFQAPGVLSAFNPKCPKLNFAVS
jgi:hypothetical protein